MKFNPLTNILYTDENKLIKKMHCPYPSLKWDNLSDLDDRMDRHCDICEHSVIETKALSDDTLLQLIKEKPDTCLKVDFNQENIRILHHV